MTILTVPVSSSYPATTIAEPDDGPVLIINSSPVNILYIGENNAIEAGDLYHTVAVAPQASFTTDGEHSYYGICSAGQSVPVLKISGATSYGPGTINVAGNVNATVAGNVNVANTPTVTIGNSPAVTISGTPTVSIGNSPAVTISGTPSVNIGNSPAVTISAGNVNVTGTGGVFPPGAYATLLNLTTPVTISNGSGSSASTSVFDVRSYQSFSLAIQAYCSAQSTAGAPLVGAIVLNWYADAGGSILLETDTYWMWLANSSVGASISTFKVGGPARGAYLQISYFNYATVNTTPIVITSINLQGNGRSLGRVSISQVAPAPGQLNSGITILPTTHGAYINDASDGIVVSEINNTNVAANGTYIILLPIFKGQCYARFQSSAVLANSPVLASAYLAVNGSPVGGTASSGALWVPGNTAGTDYEAMLTLGAAPTYMVVHATATVPTISLHIEGDPNQ